MKLWWVHNEAMVATLMAYSITKDDKWWKWFEKVSTGEKTKRERSTYATPSSFSLMSSAVDSPGGDILNGSLSRHGPREGHANTGWTGAGLGVHQLSLQACSY